MSSKSSDMPKSIFLAQWHTQVYISHNVLHDLFWFLGLVARSKVDQKSVHHGSDDMVSTSDVHYGGLVDKKISFVNFISQNLSIESQ